MLLSRFFACAGIPQLFYFLFTAKTQWTKVAQRALCNLCVPCTLVVKINWEVKKKKNCGNNATVEFASGQGVLKLCQAGYKYEQPISQ
jgi:hypothetical protein